MIKAIIISDSHGNLDNVKHILRKEKCVDAVFHLGDLLGQDEELKMMCNCPVYAVRGNCDFFSPYSLSDIVTLQNCRIFMTHGHNYYINWGWSHAVEVARENKCNVVMCGHTHIPDITHFGDVLAINPGSITQPRQPGRIPSYVVLEIEDDGQIKCSSKLVK